MSERIGQVLSQRGLGIESHSFLGSTHQKLWLVMDMVLIYYALLINLTPKNSKPHPHPPDKPQNNTAHMHALPSHNHIQLTNQLTKTVGKIMLPSFVLHPQQHFLYQTIALPSLSWPTSKHSSSFKLTESISAQNRSAAPRPRCSPSWQRALARSGTYGILIP